MSFLWILPHGLFCGFCLLEAHTVRSSIRNKQAVLGLQLCWGCLIQGMTLSLNSHWRCQPGQAMLQPMCCWGSREWSGGDSLVRLVIAKPHSSLLKFPLKFIFPKHFSLTGRRRGSYGGILVRIPSKCSWFYDSLPLSLELIHLSWGRDPFLLGVLSCSMHVGSSREQLVC